MFKLVSRCIIVISLVLSILPVYAATQYTASIPQKHPYIFTDAATLAEIKAKIAKFPWAKKAADGIIADANDLLKQPLPLPAKADIEHQRLSRKLEILSLAYLLTDDKKYAEKAGAVILKYADEYNNYLLTNYRGRVMWGESLQEALWYYQVVIAYDNIVDSGVFTPQQKKHVEDDLFRSAVKIFKVDDYKNDPRDDMHFKCYNFQAWHLMCVGITGLVMRDQDMISNAIDGPYGFKHMMGHDVRDDGLFWERSLGYHEFSMEAYLLLTEAAYRCGIDLYNMKVPDIIRDEQTNYMVNGDNGPKSFKAMFDAPFYFTFPDMSWADVADSNRGPLMGKWYYKVAYNRYHDPKYAWLLNLQADSRRRVSNTDFRALFYDVTVTEPGAFHLQGEKKFANNGQVQQDSSLFPSSGFAVLRQPTADATGLPDVNSLAVNFNCGPYGGGHNHPDKLSIVLYANKHQWFPDFGSFDYDSPIKAEWTSQTISHNTVVVDQTSQYPAGAKNVSWPVDSGDKRAIGKIDLFHADPLMSVASGWTDSVYDGVLMRRTLVHLGNSLLDVYNIKSSQPHTYDYVLHIDGDLTGGGAILTPQAGALGDKCGYQHVLDVKHGSTNKLWESVWEKGEDSLQIFAAPGEGTEIFVGNSITNRENVHMPMMVLRRKASDTSFATVSLPSRAGNVEPIPGGKSFTIQTKISTGYVYLNPISDKFSGELGVVAVSIDKPQWSALLLNGTMLKGPGKTMINCSVPMTLFVTVQDKNLTIVPGPEARGKVTIGSHTLNVTPGKEISITE